MLNSRKPNTRKPEVQQALDFHAELSELWERFYSWSQHTLGPTLAASTSFTEGDLVDLGFVLRECMNQGEEIRKEAKKRMDLAGKRNALAICMEATENGNLPPDKVEGDLARGRIILKEQPLLPKKGTPEMGELLKYLQVSEASVNAGLVKPDWNGLGDHVTELRSKGKPLPPGIGKTYPDYNISYTKKPGKVDKTDAFSETAAIGGDASQE